MGHGQALAPEAFALGMELEGYWFFPPWLMVVFHLRASTGGFRCPLPEGLAPLERDYLRLNPLKNPLRVDLRPFPPWGCLPLVLRVS